MRDRVRERRAAIVTGAWLSAAGLTSGAVLSLRLGYSGSPAASALMAGALLLMGVGSGLGCAVHGARRRYAGWQIAWTVMSALAAVGAPLIALSVVAANQSAGPAWAVAAFAAAEYAALVVLLASTRRFDAVAAHSAAWLLAAAAVQTLSTAGSQVTLLLLAAILVTLPAAVIRHLDVRVASLSPRDSGHVLLSVSFLLFFFAANSW